MSMRIILSQDNGIPWTQVQILCYFELNSMKKLKDTHNQIIRHALLVQNSIP